jgi:hypothetical protein
MAHEKAIAGIHSTDRAVEIRQHGRVAAIDDIQEQALVAIMEVNGLEQAKIGRALHQALGIAWGTLQVSNRGIAGVVRIDSDVHGAVELFVGASVAKGNALRKGTAGLDV